MAVEGSVPTLGVIVPHLVVRDAAEALDFYQRAFDAEVLFRSPSPSGVGEHIHIRIWSSLVQLSTEEPAQRREKVEGALLASPETLSASTCVFQIRVDDVDSAYKRAIDQGASPALPPMDMFWGDRYGWVRDPFGHVWAFASVHEILTPQQISDRLRQFAVSMEGNR
jgi:PhnB protein